MIDYMQSQSYMNTLKANFNQRANLELFTSFNYYFADINVVWALDDANANGILLWLD